jgi:hypothetical protein
MTNPRDGASQLLNAALAKHFNESISQKQREESLHHSNVVDNAIQDENRNSYVRYPPYYPGAQTLGIQNVVPCPGPEWVQAPGIASHGQS